MHIMHDYAGQPSLPSRELVGELTITFSLFSTPTNGPSSRRKSLLALGKEGELNVNSANCHVSAGVRRLWLHLGRPSVGEGGTVGRPCHNCGPLCRIVKD